MCCTLCATVCVCACDKMCVSTLELVFLSHTVTPCVWEYNHTITHTHTHTHVRLHPEVGAGGCGREPVPLLSLSVDSTEAHPGSFCSSAPIRCPSATRAKLKISRTPRLAGLAVSDGASSRATWRLNVCQTIAGESHVKNRMKTLTFLLRLCSSRGRYEPAGRNLGKEKSLFILNDQ